MTALLCLGLGGILVSAIGQVTFDDPVGVAAINAQTATSRAWRRPIFGRYVWVFEMTSALLITAALGAMVLAHRERLGKGPNQREWSRRRFQSGETSRPPAPSVYARYNAVDTPALLPDGSPSEVSVARCSPHRAEPLAEVPRGRVADRAGHDRGERAMSLVNYIYLATILFAIGSATVLTRPTRSSSSWASSSCSTRRTSSS